MKLKIKRPYSYEMGQLAPVKVENGKHTLYHLAHSAKGSTWEEHKYVKVVDGVYYYPDNYEGGRHISDINGSSKDNKNSSGDLNSDFYKEWERSLGNIKLDPKSVQQLLMFGKDKDGKDYDNFKAALSKSGVDISKMSDEQINEMRYKVVDHYKEEFSKEKDNFDSEGNRIKDREEKKETTESSSKKTSKSSKKETEDKTEEKSEKKTEEKKSEDDEEDEEKKKRNARYTGGYNGKNVVGKVIHSESWSSAEALKHHGILGMKWGRKNGPPYPLGPADHSASEKKAGWRKSLFGGAPKQKRAADMTDEELTSYNRRKSLENQYNKLSGQDKTGLEVTKNMVDTVSNSTRQIGNSFRNNNQKPQRERMDLSGKSDKELREAIARENLEIQYSNLFGPEKKASGRQKVAQVMDTAGDTLTLASAALSIAIGVVWLKKNGVF